MKSLACILLGLTLSMTAIAGPVQVAETADEIVVSHEGKEVLVYHKSVVQAPPEADAVYARSGFIHPLRAPNGGVVTGMHPKDHYHHLGIWHAWVHGEHESKAVDFWNLKQKTGRMQFAKTLEINNAEDSAGFVVEQEAVHYRDGNGGDPVVVLREQLRVNVRYVNDAYEVDYDVTQKNITEQPLVLTAYRYGGGIAYRAPLDWDQTNSEYLTSAGKTRKDSHTTRAKWVSMYGPTEKGEAAVTFFCHPKNHDAPQHIRTWDDGKVFFNYVPIQESSWEIKVGESIQLRYRVVISDGKPEAGELDARWQRYAGE